MDAAGRALAHAYFRGVVEPILDAEWPGLPYAAARLGPGSDGSAEQWSDNVDVLVDPDRRLAL